MTLLAANEINSVLGGIISLLSAGAISCWLLRHTESRNHVRPRMLIALAVTDTLVSMFVVIFTIILNSTPESLLDISQWPIRLQVLLFILHFFRFASWLWTAVISAHVVFVVTSNSQSVSEETELRRERLYYRGCYVIAFGVYVPLEAWTFWGKGQLFNPSPCCVVEATCTCHATIHPGFAFGLFWFILQFMISVWIIWCIAQIMMHSWDDDAARKYLRQMQWFMLFFLVLCFPQLVFDVVVHMGNKAPSPVLRFANDCQFYLPFANALIWGFSNGCGIWEYRMKHIVISSLYGDRLSKTMIQNYSQPLLEFSDSQLDVSRLETDTSWAHAQQSLSQKQWDQAAIPLRTLLDGCHHGPGPAAAVNKERRLSWLLSYALFMQAGIELRLGRPANIDRAVTLLEESLELIKVFEINFFGRINEKLGADEVCVVSFPGKYMHVWTQLCQDWRQSIACVFFPAGSVNYGKHCYPGSGDDRPAGQRSSRCYCHQLYGEQKPWGCAWFEAWMQNVEDAVAKGHTLRVYFFENDVGKGKVKWGDLAAQSQLRDKVQSKLSSTPLARLTESERHCIEGLGGSQKAEVAWLDMRGIQYEEHCIGWISRDLKQGSLEDSFRRLGSLLSGTSAMTATEWRTKVQGRLREAKGISVAGFLDFV